MELNFWRVFSERFGERNIVVCQGFPAVHHHFFAGLLGGTLIAVTRPDSRCVSRMSLRRCVNAKVSEMAALEKEAKKRPIRVGLGRVLGRTTTGARNVNGKGGLPTRPTPREIAQVREELMKLVLFLHLRE